MPARFQQVPIEQLRVFDGEVARMFEWMDSRADSGPDLTGLRAEHPGLMTLENWLRYTGWQPEPGGPAGAADRKETR